MKSMFWCCFDIIFHILHVLWKNPHQQNGVRGFFFCINAEGLGKLMLNTWPQMIQKLGSADLVESGRIYGLQHITVPEVVSSTRYRAIRCSKSSL